MLCVKLMLLLGLALEAAAAPPAGVPGRLPEDPRLDVVRQRLEEAVQRTAAAGLPAEMIASKVREGLAKGVEPRRIEAAALRIAADMESARQFVQARAPGAGSRGLIRALTEAQGAGMALGATDVLVRAKRAGEQTIRSIEILADLAARGYPAERSALVVRDVLVRDPGALGRLPAALDTIRQEQALTHVEAVDALGRGLAAASSLQAAYGRTLDDQRRLGNRKEREKVQGGDGQGKSDVAPGHLPKTNPGSEKRR